MNELSRRIAELPGDKLTLLVRDIGKKNRQAQNARIPSQKRAGQRFPLSFAQQRLWFLDQLNPGCNLFNEFVTIRLSGLLDTASLGESINEVVRRHEILRTTFFMGEVEPQQLIRPVLKISVPVIDLSLLAPGNRQDAVQQIIQQEMERPFDLACGPLLRIVLLRTNAVEHLMLLSMHHIVSDAWSAGILVRELTTLYKAFSAGQPSPLPKLPIQYADFAYWQRRLLAPEVLEDQLSYWKKVLAGAPPLLNLQTDRPRQAARRTQGAVESFDLPARVIAALKTLSREAGVSQFVVLLSVFLCLLSRYTRSDDIVVGADVANRHHGETEGLVGFFVNMLALRTDLSGDPSFRDLIRRARQVVTGAYANQDLPFERLVEELQPERDPKYTPLFQVVFNYYPFEAALNVPGLEIGILDIEHRVVRFDLSLFIVETPTGLKGSWRYSTDLFDKARIERLREHYELLLLGAIERPDLRLSELLVLADPEREQQMQRNQDLKKSNFKRFINATPKAIGSSQGRIVEESSLIQGEKSGLMLTPAVEGLDLAEWVGRNREYIDNLLLGHGALLFRNFDISSPSEFRQVAAAVSGELLNYNEPSSPRTEIGENIYTSTEYPADQWIQLHNEMSYTTNWPRKVFFYCLQPAEQGGNTPLAYSRRVFESLSASIRERFIKKQVMYVRNFGAGLDLPWQHVFQSEDRSIVEQYCRRVGIEFQWKDGGDLRTRHVCPAVTTHPGSKEMVWFNQAHAFHVSTLSPAVRQMLLEELTEENLPRNAYYGDGSRIEDSVIEEIREVYRRSTFSFAWRPGDVLILDNIAVAHGRAPFVGARKILVTMAEPDTFHNV